MNLSWNSSINTDPRTFTRDTSNHNSSQSGNTKLWLPIRYFKVLPVQFSHSVVSDSLQPHGPQHTRPPCPSPTPGVYSISCPLSRWCHPTISFSVIPFSFLQSFPASGSFLVSQLFASGGQIIVASASASVLPMNIQDWFPLGWTGLISLQFKGLSRVFSSTTVKEHQFFGAPPSSWSSSHMYLSVAASSWPLFISLKNVIPKLLCFSWFLLVAYSFMNSTFVTMAYTPQGLRIL